MRGEGRWSGIGRIAGGLILATLLVTGGSSWWLVRTYNRQQRLLMAVASGDAQRTRALLAAGANPDAERVCLTYAGQPPPVWPLLTRCPRVVLRYVVVPLAGPLSIHTERRSALVLAVEAASSDTTIVLLDHGADPNRRGRHGRTPLHEACVYRTVPIAVIRPGVFRTRPACEVRVARRLLECGADTEARDNDGYTPLLIAARNGAADVLEELLIHGADPDARDNRGRSALHWTAEINRAQHLKLLLEHGADINAKDDQGLMPLDTAIRHHRLQPERILRERGALCGSGKP